jgi:general secretion pathway protein D
MNQPAASQNSFQNRLNQIVNRAASGNSSELLTDAKIIPDERSNSLIVFANKQDLVMITNIINKVDVALAQVLIEAIVMEVSLDSGRQLGVSYLQKPHSSGQFTGAGGFNNGTPFLNPNNFISTITGTNGTSTTSNVGIPNLPGGLSYFGTFGNSFDVAMTAVATDSTVNVISRPRIMTSHAVPGSFFVGNTVPYITGTSYGYGGGSDIYGGNRSSYTQLSVGIQLDVVPFITPDGLVVMEIQQNIEQLGTAVKIDGNDVPTTVRRQANATISVRDRDTIMLGGFINADNTKSTSGVPMLKDIPYLGALFRSKTDNKRRTELVVLMRPTVLQKPEQAAIFAREETSRMYGIRQAQDENEREEAARNEKLKKDINKVRK